MTTRKAIRILRDQISKLDDAQNRNETWVFQTAGYIKDFFGVDSVQYSFISQFRFTVTTTSFDSPEVIRSWLAEKPIKARKFLEDCIETLKNIGIKKKFNRPPKTISQEFFIGVVSILVAIMIAIGGVAYYFGTKDLFNLSRAPSEQKEPSTQQKQASSSQDKEVSPPDTLN